MEALSPMTRRRSSSVFAFAFLAATAAVAFTACGGSDSSGGSSGFGGSNVGGAAGTSGTGGTNPDGGGAVGGTGGTNVGGTGGSDAGGAAGAGGGGPCTNGQTETCYSGPPGSEGVGACLAGTRTCTDGAWGACENEVVPVAETCNGVDDDCDGLVDQELGQTTCGKGACTVTVDNCVNGQAQTCTPKLGNLTEQCDGVDDNCDGNIDEGCTCVDGTKQTCYSDNPATKGVGLCKTGTQTCSGGVWGSCVGEVTPVPEKCDGLDNDCNGSTDEGNPESGKSCDTGKQGVCAAGTTTCQASVLTCLQTTQASAEVCDGLDNNCNGQADDGDPEGGQNCNTGKPGACAAGISACQNGSVVCNSKTASSPEVCDGIDNDCDGTVDDGNPGGGASCNTGLQGLCAAGTTACQNGSLKCVQNVQPTAETCDGKDNDCNGTVDDGNPGGGGSCSTGLPGVCSAGTQTCSGGSLKCVQNVQSSAEVCDGKDNNCNGSTDEGNPGGGTSCNTGLLGVCAAGTTACTNGAIKCNQNVQASTELCTNSVDDDCDGLVNEGCGCNNIAPTATGAVSGGGSSGNYTPAELNNNINQGTVCPGRFSWVSNGTTASGAWFSLTWPSAQTIGSIFIDGEHATAPICGTTGRDIKSAQVQYLSGASWVTIGTISNAENYAYNFPSPVTTTAIRLYNVTTSPGNGNSIIFEWYVYPGASCPTPTGV